MSEDWHDPMIGVDGLTCYQRWLKHEAPFKAECKRGLCVSFEHPIDCKECEDDYLESLEENNDENCN